ncbi:SRPBCC domain-containing protein [Brevibacterium picturae]|uniref:Activator of Hsp90 ATPase homologue 1/2-like C-terminal domain-containing protein n=1 Tax=Brevibacterium picturae TaxID=260553 RepID=A0ABP4M3U3_9MICO
MADKNPDWGFDRSLVIKAPAVQVWPHVADPIRLSRWWCPPPTVQIDFEPRVDSPYEEHYRDDSHEYVLTGEITVFDERCCIAILRRTNGRFGRSDSVEITLQPHGEDTKVVIVHRFDDIPFERRGEARDFFADGWDFSLELLRRNILRTD